MKKRLLTIIFAFAALASWAQTVEAPTFTFEGDNLVMTTGTANASVFYGIADLTDLQDATITATTNSLIQCNTYYDQPVEVSIMLSSRLSLWLRMVVLRYRPIPRP